MALQLNGDGTITGLAEGGLENAKIIEADIKDNEVTLAKMASIARGKLIVGDSNGDPAYLAAGSNDQVLTMDANGDVGWEAASAGATLSGSTNNQVVTVTGANAMTGEAGLTFDGTHLSVTDGNVVIATAGHGIDFSADAHATGKENELLDDYEEGTWTPALTYNGTAVGLDTPVGTYVKIGNFVCCRGRLKTTSNPDNGNVSISGLPFASSNPSNDGNAITGAMYMESADSNVTSGHPIAFGFDNSSQFDCRYSGQTGGGTNVADNCKTGTAFMTTISYQTA